MHPDRFKQTVEGLLADADVRIGGGRPWDIAVHDDRLYERVLAHGSLGLGEAYMDGWWDCDALDEFTARLLKADLESRLRRSWRDLAHVALARVANLQRRSRAFQIGERHYDIGNDLYRAMLDEGMNYSCAYWADGADTLDEAQAAKLDLCCRKLGLRPGQRVLDIGCGWGGFARHAVEHYGVEVVGITVSREQVALARERCANLPIEIRLQDYRDLDEPFDHVVSIGMFEHVGYKNYRTYMRVARRCLRGSGLFLLHTIGHNMSGPDMDAWIGKYIFPNSMLPSVRQIGAAIDGVFVMEDWHNFGVHYVKTLLAWYANFERAWPALRGRYGERFHRMWRYYLLTCAGAFRSRTTQLWQVVLSPAGVPGGYTLAGRA